ncbi:MAG: DUF1631 family protein, partial [Gammaproteobacteria bacterium]
LRDTVPHALVSTGAIPQVLSGIGPGAPRGIIGPTLAAQDPMAVQRWSAAAAPRVPGPPDASYAPWAQPASEVSGPHYYAAEDRAAFATGPIPQVLSGTDTGGMHGIINPGHAAQNLMAWQRWSATVAPRTPGSLDAMDAALAQAVSETPGLPCYAPDDLVGAISFLQANSGQPLTGGDGVIERLLGEIQGQDGERRQISARHHSTLELVSQFLGALLGDRLVGQGARAQIERLTPQVYRMALSDPGFLTDPVHPARRILESLTRLHGTVPEEAVQELEALVERVPQEADAGLGWEGIAEVLQRLENTREVDYKRNLQGVVSGCEKQQAFLQSRRKPGELAPPGHGTAATAPLPKEWLLWLDRAKRLQVGDSVQMTKGTLAGQRLDVAWIGEAHNPCVLVNGEGKKVAAWTVQELAMQLRTGAASVVDAATRSPVERAFLSVLQSIFSSLCEQAVAESPEQHARGGEATPAADGTPVREDVAGFPPLDRAEPPVDWATDIDKAIEGQALELWFQRIEPVQAVMTGGLRLRMVPRIKSGGRVLDVPEDLQGKPIEGKLQRLGRRVLREAIGWMTESRHGLEVQLLVLGLPRVQVLDTQYLELALEVLMASPVPPSKLCFEVDEATVLAVPAEVGHLVGTLRALGCRVAIGGLGRSGALGDYLSRVSADYLAIDRSFIAGMADSARDLAVVRSSQEIARALGRKTLAEGVKSEDQGRMIRDIGIDYLVGPLLYSNEFIQEPV